MCTGSGRCLIIEMLMASDERLVQRRVITHTPRLRRSSPERLGQPHLAHPTGTLAFHWRGALAGAHSPARGALRVLPLGGRATTVRAPLPVGYLPTRCVPLSPQVCVSI